MKKDVLCCIVLKLYSVSALLIMHVDEKIHKRFEGYQKLLIPELNNRLCTR